MMWFFIFPLMLFSSTLPSSILLLKHFKHASTSGSLHLSFPLPGNIPPPDMLFSQRAMKLASSSPFIFLKWHLLSEAFPHVLFKIGIPPQSPDLLHSIALVTIWHIIYLTSLFVHCVSQHNWNISLLREDIYVSLVHYCILDI